MLVDCLVAFTSILPPSQTGDNSTIWLIRKARLPKSNDAGGPGHLIAADLPLDDQRPGTALDYLLAC